MSAGPLTGRTKLVVFQTVADLHLAQLHLSNLAFGLDRIKAELDVITAQLAALCDRVEDRAHE